MQLSVPTTVLTVALAALLPVAATVLGALAAAVRPPGPAVRSGIQHFAAGVVFAVVAVELLPDVTRVHDPVEIGVAFAAGVALMLGARRFSARFEGAGAHGAEHVTEDHLPDASGSPRRADYEGAARLGRLPTGQLIAVGIDVLLDGLLVGIAFATGAKAGVLLALALSLELLSLGLALAAPLAAAGAGRARAVLIPTTLACLLPVGALAGETVLRGASPHTLAGVLAFGAAALLYLVTEELLVEAHETRDTTAATAMFFAGFLLFLLLGMAK